MRKLALVLATAATLAVTAVAAPSPAHARYGWGPGIFGGLVAGALIAGVASSAYGYGPYGYGGGGYYPAYYGGGYYPAYYGGYYPRYYGGYAYPRPYATAIPARLRAPIRLLRRSPLLRRVSSWLASLVISAACARRARSGRFGGNQAAYRRASGRASRQ